MSPSFWASCGSATTATQPRAIADRDRQPLRRPDPAHLGDRCEQGSGPDDGEDGCPPRAVEADERHRRVRAGDQEEDGCVVGPPHPAPAVGSPGDPVVERARPEHDGDGDREYRAGEPVSRRRVDEEERPDHAGDGECDGMERAAQSRPRLKDGQTSVGRADVHGLSASSERRELLQAQVTATIDGLVRGVDQRVAVVRVAKLVPAVTRPAPQTSDAQRLVPGLIGAGPRSPPRGAPELAHPHRHAVDPFSELTGPTPRGGSGCGLKDRLARRRLPRARLPARPSVLLRLLALALLLQRDLSRPLGVRLPLVAIVRSLLLVEAAAAASEDAAAATRN